MKRVLVLGGSGALGSALLHELAAAGATGAFTFMTQHDAALRLSATLGFTAHAADLRRPDAVERLFATLADADALPEVVVHCAGTGPTEDLESIDAAQWDELQAIHGRAALQCAQQMARRNLRGALLLVAALDGIAPVPAPAHYAASQGALWGLTQALARELGPKGILVNLVTIGALDAGISRSLGKAQQDAYRRFAALGRLGTCAEAARALRWMALENSYLNGVQLPVSGGLG